MPAATQEEEYKPPVEEPVAQQEEEEYKPPVEEPTPTTAAEVLEDV